MVDVATIKRAAAGRRPKILTSLGGIPAELLDGKNHPCPKAGCGGSDRFRVLDIDKGAVFCNQCFNEKNGDGIAALQWLNGWDFKTTVAKLTDHLEIQNGNKSSGQKLAKNAKTIKPINSTSCDTLLCLYGKAKPPVTPDGIKKCGGTLVRWRNTTCIRFDGRADVDAQKATAIVVVRTDGKAFPPTKT